MPDDAKPLTPEELDALEACAQSNSFIARVIATVRDRERQQRITLRLLDGQRVIAFQLAKERNESLSSDFAFVWDTYACASDDTLDTNALALKHKLIEAVKRSSWYQRETGA